MLALPAAAGGRGRRQLSRASLSPAGYVLRPAPRAAQVEGARGVCGARRPGLPSGAVLASGRRAELSALAALLSGGRPALYGLAGRGRGRAEAGAAPLAGKPVCREERGRPERGAWAAGRKARVPGGEADPAERNRGWAQSAAAARRGALEEREAGAAIGAQDGLEMERKRGAKGGTK